MTGSGPKVGYTEEDIELILKAQEVGVMIVDKHFRPVMKEIAPLSYNRPEVASALIMLAYETLRTNRSEEETEGAFRSLLDFAQQRIEHNVKQRGRGVH